MNVYLVGYRGSGKSSVGPLIAQRLGWEHLDTDRVIAELAKKSIAEIFADDGEETFREIESKVIAVAASDQHLVVSLGGGAVIEMDNRDALKSSGRAVWLRIKPETAWQRINDDTSSSVNRPALTDKDGLDEVKTLIAQRKPIYEECADFTIDVDELSLEDIADRVISWWKSVDQDN